MRGDAVELVLRLPTFWCAPNFAYLMASDARKAVLQVPGVHEVRVTLRDHMYSDEISSGKPFAEAFGDQAESDDMAELRQLFNRKAFGMRQEQLVRFLQEVGPPRRRSSRRRLTACSHEAPSRWRSSTSSGAQGWASRAPRS